MKSFEITYRLGGKENACIWFAWTADEAIAKCKRTLPHVEGWKAIREDAEIVKVQEV